MIFLNEQLELDLAPAKINESFSISKLNTFIESSYKLTAMESKIILTLFSNVQPDDKDINTYVFPIKPFAEMLGTNSKNIYGQMKIITKNLMQKVHSIEVDGKTSQVAWLSYVEYDERQGTVTMRFDNFWKQFVLDLQREFTQYKLGNIAYLKSHYSIRLYEILKKWQPTKNKQCEYTVKKLKEMLGLEEGQYKQYGIFKKRIIEEAQKQLKKTSDIMFDFEEIKAGRRVESIRFTIKTNPDVVYGKPVRHKKPEVIEGKAVQNIQIDKKKLVAESQKEGRAFDRLLEKGMREFPARKLLKEYGAERILSNIEYTEYRNSIKAIKNVPGYITRAVRGDYAATKSNKSTKPKKSASRKPVAKKQVTKKPEYTKPLSDKDDNTTKIDTALGLFNKKIEIMHKLNYDKESIQEETRNEIQRLKKQLNLDSLTLEEQKHFYDNLPSV